MRPGTSAGAVPWRGEWLGAVNATAAALPFVLTYGYIVYGALGPAAAQVGLRASVIAVVIGGALMLLCSRMLVPAASPSASATLILGGAVQTLVQDPALRPDSPNGLALLLAATALIVCGSGVLLAMLGLMRAGSLVRFVPQPVLAGFMNGVAVLIVVSQLPPLLGLPVGAWQREGPRALGSWHGQAIAVALGTAALVVLIRRRWPGWPAPLVALLLASAVVLGLQQALPAGRWDLAQIGPLQAAWPVLDTVAPLFSAAHRALLQGHAATLLETMLLLALIGALESVFNIAGVDQLTGRRSDPNRELIALGLVNVMCGLLAGLPLVVLRLRAMATYAGGGRSWRAVLLSCVLLALVFTFGLPAVQRLPTAVVAGIVVMLAWALVDQWTRRLARQWWAGDRSAELRWSLAVVALVCAVILAWGFAAGVAAGVLVAMLVFIRALNRSLVRTRYSGAQMSSRRVRSAAQQAQLAAVREGIQVVELEGALFFGNSDRLQQLAEPPRGGLNDLVIDLRRVSTIDASGAMAIEQLDAQLRKQGVALRLAGVTPHNRHGQALASQGLSLAAGAGSGLHIHVDADRALEAAEDAALHRLVAAPQPQQVQLADCQLLEGLDEAQRALLLARLRPRRLQAGERLFTQGDEGRALYLLMAGSISVVDHHRDHRYASFSPGMCFGETAVLDGGGRTADAVADVDSLVHELSAADFLALQREAPALAALLYRNLARHLSQRLRAAVQGWQLAAG